MSDSGVQGRSTARRRSLRVRGAGLFAAAAIVAAACGDSAPEAVPTTTADASSDAAGTTTTSTTTTTSSTTTTTSTATSTTTAAPTTTAPVAAIEPQVVCVDFDDVAFAYVNTGEVGLVVPPGDSSVINGDEADLALVPVVFAAGRNSPAFWVTAVDPDLPVSWTVVGPDGVERTATSDGAPECTNELEERVPADPRNPEISVIDLELSEGESVVTVSLELTGVPEQSVCGQGLEPRPVAITLTASWPFGGEEIASVDGPLLEFSADVPAGASAFVVSVLVLDQCALGDVVQQSWPSGAFHEVYETGICLTDLCAWRLPATGGGRSRPS